MIDPEDVGHWEGDLFVFDEPLKVTVLDEDGQPVERTMGTIDCSVFVAQDGITKEDVVHAMVNQVSARRVSGTEFYEFYGEDVD